MTSRAGWRQGEGLLEIPGPGATRSGKPPSWPNLSLQDLPRAEKQPPQIHPGHPSMAAPAEGTGRGERRRVQRPSSRHQGHCDLRAASRRERRTCKGLREAGPALLRRAPPEPSINYLTGCLPVTLINCWVFNGAAWPVHAVLSAHWIPIGTCPSPLRESSPPRRAGRSAPCACLAPQGLAGRCGACSTPRDWGAQRWGGAALGSCWPRGVSEGWRKEGRNGGIGELK